MLAIFDIIKGSNWPLIKAHKMRIKPQDHRNKIQTSITIMQGIKTVIVHAIRDCKYNLHYKKHYINVEREKGGQGSKSY
jgi:hypothetical protein